MRRRPRRSRERSKTKKEKGKINRKLLTDSPDRQYMWHDSVHATPPIHNATASWLLSDCFGTASPKRYCS